MAHGNNCDNVTAKAIDRHARKAVTRKQQRSKKRGQRKDVDTSTSTNFEERLAGRGPWTGA